MDLRYVFPSVTFFLVAIFFSGCEKENMCDCLKSTGKIITEKRPLAEFSQLEVRKNVSVTLYKDTVNYAEVEAGENLIALVRTEISDGILKITNDNVCNWVRSYKKEIHVNLHFKELSYVRHYGSKEISSNNTWKNHSVNAALYGGGD